jgi:hypothetical protein
MLSPVLGELQPPVTVRRDGRSDLRGKTAPCPECGREVDRRGMKNHIEWVQRGNRRCGGSEEALGVVGWEAPAKVGG